MATRTARLSPPGPILSLGALSRGLLRAGVLSACAAGLGCQPSLSTGPAGGGDPGDPPREPEILVEPEAALDAVPPVLRVHVVPAEGAEVDLSRVLLVRGHVGDGHVRQVEHGDLSQALTDRILTAITWPLDDGSAVLAPTVALDAGATYGVLSGDPALGADLRVLPEDAAPLLRRTWPPSGAPAGPFAIFCGDAPLSSPPADVTLGPGALEAAADIGVFGSLGAGCLRLDLAGGGSEPSATGDVAVTAAVPPPLLVLADGSTVRLEPAPIAVAAPLEPPPPVAPLDCASPEIPFGPGCALVADDRLFVHTPEAALLWVVRSAAAGESVRVTRAGEPWVVHGFVPGSAAQVSLVALDALGRAHTSDLSVFTLPPMPHVVLSEVLANPLGPEPDQEWIELYNDGLAGADLTGYALADLGGVTPLPPAILAPGAFALVVNETFLEDDEIDPVPAPGTTLLRVPKLGKDGLKNDGEPLKLLDAERQVVSRFPIAPKPKAGQSVARVSPAAPDGVAASFMVATPTPGAPNEPPP